MGPTIQEMWQWAESIEPTMPEKCPQCGMAMRKAKINLNFSTLHAMGGHRNPYYMDAACPHCRHVIATKNCWEEA